MNGWLTASPVSDSLFVLSAAKLVVNEATFNQVAFFIGYLLEKISKIYPKNNSIICW